MCRRSALSRHLGSGRWILLYQSIVHGDCDRTRGSNLYGRKAHTDTAILSLNIVFHLHTHQVLSPRSSHYPCSTSGP